MKPVFLAAAIAAATISTSAIGADVGVSINIGEPGFFGRIELGDAPRPELINPAPIVAIRGPGGELPPPIYLHVRPGHERNWRRYCHTYNACGQPVYFVRDDWYNNTYVPHYREHHRDHVERHDERRDEHREEHRDERRDHREENHDRREEHHDNRDDH
jgi:hypothetical protein